MKPELRTMPYLGIALCIDEAYEGQRFPMSDLSWNQIVFPLLSNILVIFQGSLLILDFIIKPLPPCPMHALCGEMKLCKAEVEEGNWEVKLTLNRNETDKRQLKGQKWRHEANENKPPHWEKPVQPGKFFQFG